MTSVCAADDEVVHRFEKEKPRLCCLHKEEEGRDYINISSFRISLAHYDLTEIIGFLRHLKKKYNRAYNASRTNSGGWWFRWHE